MPRIVVPQGRVEVILCFCPLQPLSKGITFQHSILFRDVCMQSSAGSIPRLTKFWLNFPDRAIFVQTAKFWVGHRVGHGLAQVLYTPRKSARNIFKNFPSA